MCLVECNYRTKRYILAIYVMVMIIVGSALTLMVKPRLIPEYGFLFITLSAFLAHRIKVLTLKVKYIYLKIYDNKIVCGLGKGVVLTYFPTAIVDVKYRCSKLFPSHIEVMEIEFHNGLTLELSSACANYKELKNLLEEGRKDGRAGTYTSNRKNG